MGTEKELTAIQKLHFILLAKGRVWTFHRLETTWASLVKLIAKPEIDEFNSILIEKVFDELYPDGLTNGRDEDFFIKLATLLAHEDKTAIAPQIGISMYIMKVRMKNMNWKEREKLMIEKIFNDKFCG